MNEEIQKVPLLSVPPSSKQTKEEKQKEVPSIPNELGIKAGKFGWCVNCRQSANLYCKHTRHPVCSFDCKVAHIRLLEDANQTNLDRESPRDSPEPVVRDALLIFNRIC
jgi:brefeldin A-inhibited guanine nucleotide-exchange protein